jgi:nitroreductase
MNIQRRSFLQSGAVLGSAMLLGSLASRAAAADSPPASTADIWDVFKKRRSVRKFKPDAIPEMDIARILDAARTPPTSGNQQPWKFLVIRDPEKIRQLKEACVKLHMDRFDGRKDDTAAQEKFETGVRSRLAGYFSAPVYIVVLTDNKSQYPGYNHWDGPMAAGFLTLAARALGYGTVFITDVIPDSVTREVLRIPDRYTRVCITPLGIPVEWPDAPPKKKLEEFIAYETL